MMRGHGEGGGSLVPAYCDPYGRDLGSSSYGSFMLKVIMIRNFLSYFLDIYADIHDLPSLYCLIQCSSNSIFSCVFQLLLFPVNAYFHSYSLFFTKFKAVLPIFCQLYTIVYS